MTNIDEFWPHLGQLADAGQMLTSNWCQGWLFALLGVIDTVEDCEMGKSVRVATGSSSFPMGPATPKFCQRHGLTTLPRGRGRGGEPTFS